jgi:hypothetical protein
MRFRSNFEKTIALSLEREGVPFGYESRHLKYCKEHTYTPDFVLTNGIIIEAKGRFLASDRTKHLLVRKYNPELDIRFLFMNARNRLSSRSRTTYAEWCDKHGFIWAQTTIPKEWLL